MPLMSGRLWVVATPLGNLGDFSSRAREIIEGCPVILAEDTRRSGRLLAAMQIDRPRMISFFEHNEQNRLQQVVDLLESGSDVALLSDAGTPVVSDPGYRLVRTCHERGIRVSPVPGPSSPVAALSISGLPACPFTFLGFLPRRKGEVENLFLKWKDVWTTLVFFERKNRLEDTLRSAFAVMDDREYCVAREMTKRFEEVIRGRLSSLDLPEEIQGEITVVLGPPGQASRSGRSQVEECLARELAKGIKPREAAKEVRKHVQGWTGKEIYALVHDNNTGSK